MEDVKKEVLKLEVVTRRMVVTAVVMAFAFATLMSPVTASVKPAQRTIMSYGRDFFVNYDNITIWLDGTKASALVGQTIQFYNATGNASGKVTLTGISENNAGEVKFSDLNGRIDISGIKTGDYNVTAEPDAIGCNATVISVGEASMELKLKKGTTTVTSIPQGTRITVKFTTSLDPNDGVTLKVTDPGGNIMRTNPADGTVFDKVNASHVSDLEINTAGWELGTYKFKVSTEEEYARGLRKDSAEVELKVLSPELKIEAKKTEVVVSEKVKLTVTGVPDHNISISVERSAEHATFPGGTNDNPASTKIGNFSDSIDADGKMEYVVYFDKTGSYTVKVNDLDSATEDFVDIAVSEKKVTFTMPNTCMIGSDLVVNGTANTGKTVDIAIENCIVKVDVPIDTRGKFEVKLPTPATSGTGVEGAIKIKAFIDGDFSLEQGISGIVDDGSFMVLMTTGTLTAESSTILVPPGDSFTLSGTAPGKTVDVFIIGPKGGGGRGMNPANSEANGLPHGIVYEAASVSSDFTWSVEIDVDENADTGAYLIFVLSPGKNKVYDGIRDDELLNGIRTKYFGGDLSRLAGKAQEQINATLWDATIGTAGSDDFMKKITIKVGTAEVKLYSIADVVIGDDLVITGTSNREGHSIIVKVKGPVNLGTKFATVENGKFKATFSTSEALTGEYTVEADDGEGHEDTTTVNIVMPVRTEGSPTPAPTNSSLSTIPHEVPESTPMIQPENSSASALSQLPVPGFEAVLVITTVVIVYLFIFLFKKRGS
jgi:hypothetical protein